MLKIDVEGHEASILASTEDSDWLDTDAIAEIGTEQNAEIVFNKFKNSHVNLFSQKNNWDK